MTAFEFSTVSVADFLKTPKQFAILNEANKLVFVVDPVLPATLNHQSTTQEIKLHHEVFKTVVFSDRKAHLKWRNKLRSALVVSRRRRRKQMVKKQEMLFMKSRWRGGKKKNQDVAELFFSQQEITDQKLRYGKLEIPVIEEEAKTLSASIKSQRVLQACTKKMQAKNHYQTVRKRTKRMKKLQLRKGTRRKGEGRIT